jgi:predicted transposase YbfD/YdcC
MNALEHFSSLIDPRIDRTKRYPLSSLVFLTISAVVSGCDDLTEVEFFGQLHLRWFQRHGHFTDGFVPSHDTLGRLFQRLDPEAFNQCFARWVAQVCRIPEGSLVAIDGKRLRGSYDRFNGQAAIHLISAWSSEHQLVLGQLAVEDKSSETTAIPAFLQAIDLKGAVVSIDAAGCHLDTATLIREGQADYLLGLKANQPTLLNAVEMAFTHRAPVSHHVELDKGHGRLEQRTCDVLPASALPPQRDPWPELSSLVRVVALRHELLGGTPTEEVRFYLSSLKADAQRFNALVRAHWSIENRMHWTLDVTFQEDASRLRKGHAHLNMATIRRTALNICKLHHAPKLILKRKRMAAAASDEFRDQLLGL